MKLNLEIEFDEKEMPYWETCRMANIISAFRYSHENTNADILILSGLGMIISKFLTKKLKEQIPKGPIDMEVFIGERVPALIFDYGGPNSFVPVLLDHLFNEDYSVNPFYLIGILLIMEEVQLDEEIKKTIKQEIKILKKHFKLKRVRKAQVF